MKLPVLLLQLLLVAGKIQKYDMGGKDTRKAKQRTAAATPRGDDEPARTTTTKAKPVASAKVNATMTAAAAGAVDVSGGLQSLGGLACDLEDYTCIARTYKMSYLFPTPLLYQQVVVDQRTAQFNEEIKELMLELEEENDGCKFNLHGGYRSKDGFLNRPERAIVWLKSEIEKRAQLMLALSGAPDTPFFVDGWGAVLRHGHAQTVHVHPQCMFAGVYYVAAPESVFKSGKRGGCLTFHDPRPGAEMTQFVRGKDLYGTKAEVCPPKNGGMMVLFPSWLPHEVQPMPAHKEYDGPRIAISFNVLFKP